MRSFPLITGKSVETVCDSRRPCSIALVLGQGMFLSSARPSCIELEVENDDWREFDPVTPPVRRLLVRIRPPHHDGNLSAFAGAQRKLGVPGVGKSVVVIPRGD